MWQRNLYQLFFLYNNHIKLSKTLLSALVNYVINQANTWINSLFLLLQDNKYPFFANGKQLLAPKFLRSDVRGIVLL